MKKITILWSIIAAMVSICTQSYGQCTANNMTFAVGTTTCINSRSYTCTQTGWQDNNASCLTDDAGRRNPATELLAYSGAETGTAEESILPDWYASYDRMSMPSAIYWVGTDPQNNIYAVPAAYITQDRAKCLIRLACHCVVNSLIQLNGDQVNSGSLNHVTVNYISPGAQCQ